MIGVILGSTDEQDEAMERVRADKDIVNKDRDTLYLGNLNTVEFDLDLPVRGKYGSRISWTSEQERFLSKEGKVFRPAYGMGSRVVRLTACFRYGEAEAVKVYKVRILEDENRIRVRHVRELAVTAQTGEQVWYPAAAVAELGNGDIVSHPVVWDEADGNVYQSPGSFLVKGRLAGTGITVVLRVIIKKNVMAKPEIPKISLRDFEKERIRLLPDSDCFRGQEWMLEYLLHVDDDSMLYNFRTACGLPVQEAEAMNGWEAADSLIRGHTTGHYLSALAKCYHACEDERIKKKADYMIGELKKCQDVFQMMPGIQEGFLSAYSEEQFDLLESYTPYPEIWAPYYTLHKIMASLLDCYRYIGNETAFSMVTAIGDWICRRLFRLDRKTRTAMWNMYIAGEYGGINESLASLYRLTGKEQYIECARMFDNDKLYVPLLQETDALSGMHANQHIPQIIGALEIYMSAGERRYYDIAKRFWKYVVEGHTYAPGGTGEGEMFHRSGEIGVLLTNHTQETCASYNMLKLTRRLYQLEQDPSYMDYYERVMLNHILAVQEKPGSGESTYFWPLAPGSRREFLRENSCCHGTGMESPFQYGDAVYFHKDETVFVNLFVPSVLSCEDGTQLKLSKAEGSSERIRITLNSRKYCTLAVRKPSWVKEDFQVWIDQRELTDPEVSNGYFFFPVCSGRELTAELLFPFHLELLRTQDLPDKAAVKAGPYILAAISESREYLELDINEENLEEQLIRKGNELEYEYRNLRFIPLCRISEEAFHVYVDVSSGNKKEE